MNVKRVVAIARWVILIVIARVAGWLGCYVIRDAQMHEAVQVLSHIQRMRHAVPLGRKSSERRKEDDYIDYVLQTLRRGVLPRRTRRARPRTASGR